MDSILLQEYSSGTKSKLRAPVDDSMLSNVQSRLVWNFSKRLLLVIFDVYT